MIINVEGADNAKAVDIIKVVTERIGEGGILAVRPRQGKEYELTLEKEEMCDELMNGLTIKGTECEVKKLQNRDYVVSFMHLPVYLEDEDILAKLEGWGVCPISKIKRRLYPGTNVEDGTRFAKVRFPREVISLPYSTKLETAEGPQYFRVMHSHQVKTCRLCMSPDHLVKDCPDFKCYKCEEKGHFARDCRTVRCPECQIFLNKCECWIDEEERGGAEQVNEQMHERNNEEERQTDEGQEEGLQQKETEGQNDNEHTMTQDIQGTEMEILDSFNAFVENVEIVGQERMEQSKEMDSEDEIKMDKGREGRGQRRRRTLKVKPNLEGARKKIMTETNRYDVLRGLEGENDE